MENSIKLVQLAPEASEEIIILHEKLTQTLPEGIILETILKK